MGKLKAIHDDIELIKKSNIFKKAVIWGKKNPKLAVFLTLVSLIVFLLLAPKAIYLWNDFLKKPTQVSINVSSLDIKVEESVLLTATVIYSNNTQDNAVLWTSSNKNVATVQQDGTITAIAPGTTTITVQASKNNSTESATCVVTVYAPPSGYSIRATPTSAPLGSFISIYVEPYDSDVSRIQIYAVAPSGKVWTPELAVNNLYHFYSEYGTWTLYAELENKGGIYVACRPEDYFTVEITN